MISVHFQGKPFNITVIQVYALTSYAEEAETEWFYEDLQDLELTPQKDVLFIIGDLNAKVGSQEITWSNRQTWPWHTKQSRSKVNRVFPRECTSPITSWQIDGGKWKQWQILFSYATKSLRTVPAAMKLKDACSLVEKL